LRYFSRNDRASSPPARKGQLKSKLLWKNNLLDAVANSQFGKFSLRDAIRSAGNFAFCNFRRETMNQRNKENQQVRGDSAPFRRLAPRLR
jgi:hypothetical protein